MSKRAASLGLGERLEVEAAIESAFAPLRGRRSSVGPTRVRAAVRWGRVDPQPPVPWAAAISRISELGLAVGMSAFVFAAALTSVPPPSGPIPVTETPQAEELLDQILPELKRFSLLRATPAAPRDVMLSIIRSLKRPSAFEETAPTILPGAELPAFDLDAIEDALELHPALEAQLRIRLINGAR